MKKQTSIFMLVALLFFAVSAFAQTRNVSGTVTDENGDPVIAATVNVTGTDVRVLTDLDGSFSIQAPSSAETLTISYVGMATQVAPIGTGVVNVVMASDDTLLEGVVVTALGIERQEKALGYSVAEVNSDEIVNQNPTGFLESLKSNVAGVQTNTTSGAAGSSTRVVLRGQTTLNGDNQALIVIDGIRMNNSNFASEGTTAGVAYSNRAIDLNPDDIASITVLKGAAAAALYGSEASNGALIITTKKGSKGKPKFTINNTLTMSTTSKMVELQNVYAQGTGGDYRAPETGFPYSWGPNISDLYYNGDSEYKWDYRGALVTDPSAGTQAVAFDNVDDYFRTGVTSKNGIGVTGGSETVTYRANLDYLNEEGFVPNNDFKRINGTFGSEANFLDNRLRFSNSLQFINSGGTRIQQGSNISGVMLGLLRTPISFNNSLGYQFPDGSQRNYRGGGGYDNPYWVSYNTPFEDDVNRFLGSFSTSYDLTDWMTATARVGLDNYSDFRTQIYEIGSRSYTTGRVFEDNYTYRQVDAYFTLNGDLGLTSDDKLDVAYTVGANLFGSKLDNSYVQGDGLSFVGFPAINTASSITQANSLNRRRTMSGFGSLEFGYDNLLYVTLTGRQDYMSTLMSEGKELSDVGIFYPSVSASFLASEILDKKNLDLLKLRASWAQTGTGAPSVYATSTPFVAAAPSDGWTNGIQYPYNGVAGFTLSGTQGNTELTPAVTDELEFGAEARMFDDRLKLDIAYYTRKDEDQILAVPVSDATGYTSTFLNSGSLETDGWDIALGGTPIRTNDFSWDVNATFTTWTTIVTKLADGVQEQTLGGFTGSTISNVVGLEYGQFFGNPYLRNEAGQIIIDDDPLSATYGFPKEDPVQQAIANPNPDFLMGINNSLNYKNFDLSFLFDIREGGVVWNGTKGALTTFGRSKITESRGEIRVFDGVKQSTGEANDIAVVVDQGWFTGNGGGFGNVSEPFMEDASWVRLRNAQLGYNLTKTNWSKLPFDEVRFNVIGNNLLLWTPFDGDPEASLQGSASNAQGLSYFELPSRKSVAFGLNFKF